jgi:hypothetical protein
MRAHFIWPSSNLTVLALGGEITYGEHYRDLYWVSATLEEVREKLLPLMTPEALELTEKALSDVTLMEDSLVYEGKLYFIVSDPKSSNPMICLWLRVYPYSGMWNGACPLIAIGPPKDDFFREPDGIEIPALDVLHSLGEHLKNRWYLTPAPPAESTLKSKWIEDLRASGRFTEEVLQAMAFDPRNPA